MRLEADGLGAERGGDTVFTGLSFALQDGDALVVTGPNGSGKSTLLRLLAGLLTPAAGRMSLSGDAEQWPDIATASHYLGHANAMKPALSVGENLSFWRDFLGHERMPVDQALEAVGLPDIAHLPYGYLSTGQRRRVSIARMLASFRPVWLLDEPTAGLDAGSERRFAALMADHLHAGGIVVAATHLPLGLDGAAELRLGAA